VRAASLRTSEATWWSVDRPSRDDESLRYLCVADAACDEREDIVPRVPVWLEPGYDPA
jgi:hypothetical protein